MTVRRIRCALLLLGAATACIDDRVPTQPTANRSAAYIVARFTRLAVETRAMSVTVSYERTQGSASLGTTRLSLDAGQTQITVPVNLAACLADSTHTGGAHSCTIDATISLLDAADAVLDRRQIGPLVATPGGVLSPDTVSLYTPTASIAVNDAAACTIRFGVTYCWGTNTSAGLGDGTTASRRAPVVVSGGFRFVALAGAFVDTCGLADTGIVACWGNNTLGELGIGNTTRNISTPTPVVTSVRFKSVVSGAVLFCALALDDTAYCWGGNDIGGVGDGTTTFRLVPTPVSGGLKFVSLGVGQLHACGITSTGAAYCWGDNVSGDVGDGTTTQRLTPVAVSGGLSFKSITGGNAHTCGLTAAGVAYCWGLNNSGELGDGTTTSRSVPTAVAGGRTFTKIQAAHNGNGEGSTCALESSGTLYCWGDNRRGQLGDGTSINRLTPTPASGSLRFMDFDLDNNGGCGLVTIGSVYCWGVNSFVQPQAQSRPLPAPVAGATAFTNLSSGTGASCGVAASGAAYCWGTNVAGTLGDGSTQTSGTPRAVTGGISFTSIETSGTETCGLAAGGTAYCWGQVFNVGPRVAPAPVSGSTSFVSIQSAGTATSQHTCGLTAGGSVLCWGGNSSGQLGDGTTTSRQTPTPVAGGRVYSAIAVFIGGGCGLSNGIAYCWGAAPGLGNGSASASTTPVAVGGGLSFVSITGFGSHVCALAADRSAYCWGLNSNGQFGNGTTSSVAPSAPVLVSGNLAFSKISAGTSHTCGITTGGATYCWGVNGTGGLGDGTEVDRLVPTLVAGGSTFVDVSAGSSHTCARTAAGIVYCWGSNQLGQLGDGTEPFSYRPIAVALP